MESSSVLSSLVLIVLCCSTLVSSNSRLTGAGSAEAPCDYVPGNSDAVMCTENQMCYKRDVDDEACCESDPCLDGTNQCDDTTEVCISRGNCDTDGDLTTEGTPDVCDKLMYKTEDCMPKKTSVCDTSDCGTGNTCDSENEVCVCTGGSTPGKNAEGQLVCTDPAVLTATTETYTQAIIFRIVNLGWQAAYEDPLSMEFKEVKNRIIAAILQLLALLPGRKTVVLRSLSESTTNPGSVLADTLVIFDDPVAAAAAEETFNNGLINRTNAMTGIDERWASRWLQLDASQITFTDVSEESPVSSSDNSLPVILAVVASVTAITVVVIVIYFVGRVCRYRAWATTYDIREDTVTSYEVTLRPNHVYTRHSTYGPWGRRLPGEYNYSHMPTDTHHGGSRGGWSWRDNGRRGGNAVYNSPRRGFR